MLTSTDQHRKALAMHRRQTWLYIVFPAFLGLLIILAVLVVVLLFPRRAQVSIVADVALIVFMLCPAVLCMLPLTLLLLAGALGMNQAHRSTARALLRAESASASAAASAVSLTNRINQKTIDVSARFGLLHKWLSVFDRSDSPDNEGAAK